MKAIKPILGTLFLFFSNLSYGDLKKDCTEEYLVGKGMHTYRFMADAENCFLSVNPEDTNGMVYRSYLLSNKGIFLVFNSYGPDEGTEFTGARVYYFFPRGEKLSSSFNGTTLSVQTASKNKFYFEESTGKILKMSMGEIYEDPSVNDQNNGGVEILKYKGLLLDVGYARGHDPVLERGKSIYFQDENSTRCAVLIEEVFTYSGASARFTYKTDSDLKAFLKNRCPQLKVSF